jgi:hypothetical protein
MNSAYNLNIFIKGTFWGSLDFIYMFDCSWEFESVSWWGELFMWSILSMTFWQVVGFLWVLFTNKIECHDIAEILLMMMLNTSYVTHNYICWYFLGNNAARTIGGEHVPHLLNLYQEWHQLDTKHRHVNIRRAILNILKNITNLSKC